MTDAYLSFEAPDRATDWLREQGARPDAEIDLIGCALALAALDRPRVGLRRYVEHLDAIAASVAARGATEASPLADRIAAVNAVLFDELGYFGDTETYDDLQNANLLQVIDRRRGLPITLSLLYLHAAWRQGWAAEGVNFPGHFVVRMAAGPERAIVDPFNAGQELTASDLRGLLKLTHGDEVELAPEHSAPARSRDILLRLQNNLKMRLIRAGRIDRALDVVDRMLLLVPDNAALWHAKGALNAELGHLADAIAALEHTTDLDADGAFRHQVASLMQTLRKRLN